MIVAAYERLYGGADPDLRAVDNPDRWLDDLVAVAEGRPIRSWPTPRR